MTIGINVSGAEYSWMPFAGSADLNYLESQGTTLIRLPISWERMQPTLNGPLDQTYLSGLKNFLSDAANHGIQVIVDVHNYARYNLNYAQDAAANYGITAPNTADATPIGTAAVPISSFASFWGKLAGALNGQAGVAGYDLMNEPYALPTPTTWATAAQAAVNAIRGVDTNTPIYVEGYQWAGALNWVQNNGNLHIVDPSNKIVYEAHLYFDTWSSGQYAQTYTQQGATPDIGVKAIQPFLQWLQQNNYKGFVGEFGVPYNDPKWLPVLSNFMDALQAAGVSGTMWTYAYSDPSGKNPWWPNSNTIDPMNIKNLPGVDQPQMEVLFAHTAPAISGISGTAGTVGNGITDSNHLTLTGVAASGSTVQVFDGAALLGTTKAGSNGAWTFSTGTLANGSHSFTSKDVDAAGTVSVASAAHAVVVNSNGSTPVAPVNGSTPAAPVIATFSNDSGVAGDHITNHNTLTLTGTAEAGSTVKVFDGTTLLGSAIASSSGAWSYTTAALANGAHSLTATATDAAGNTGAHSAALSATVDTTAPLAPTISDNGLAANHITNHNTLTLTGTAEAGSTVKVFDGTTLLGSAIASSSGAWSYTTAALANGAHSLTATATDAAGNTGAHSAALSATVDTTAPLAPTISDNGLAANHITNHNTLTLTGTAEAGSTVKVFDGTTLLGSAIANGSGAWSYTTAALANGAHSLTATATDAAGNTGAHSAALSATVDTTAPLAPTISDNGLAANHITNHNTLTLTGTAEAGSTVKVFDGTTLLGSAIANGSGAWSYTTAALANGAHSLTAAATDAAGNTGAHSATLAITVDTTAPVVPPATPVTPTITSFSNDTGVAGDRITSDNTLTLTGTAAVKGPVKVFDGTTLLGSAIANGSGVWSYTTGALANGAHSLTAAATDAAGNTGAHSAALSATVDTTAPLAPTISDNGLAANHITNHSTQTLTGTAEAGSTVKVYDGETLLGSAAANGSGAWSYTTAALADGAHSLAATATDSAGNAGVASTALAVSVNTDSSAHGPGGTGSGTAAHGAASGSIDLSTLGLTDDHTVRDMIRQVVSQHLGDPWHWFENHRFAANTMHQLESATRLDLSAHHNGTKDISSGDHWSHGDMAGAVASADPATSQLLISSHESDKITGGPKADVLVAGPGHHTMTGMGGADTFVIGKGQVDATITDFTPGVDKLEFVESAEHGNRTPQIRQELGNAVVTVGHDHVVLPGVDIHQLQPHDLSNLLV